MINNEKKQICVFVFKHFLKIIRAFHIQNIRISFVRIYSYQCKKFKYDAIYNCYSAIYQCVTSLLDIMIIIVQNDKRTQKRVNGPKMVSEIAVMSPRIIFPFFSFSMLCRLLLTHGLFVSGTCMELTNGLGLTRLLGSGNLWNRGRFASIYWNRSARNDTLINTIYYGYND